MKKILFLLFGVVFFLVGCNTDDAETSSAEETDNENDIEEVEIENENDIEEVEIENENDIEEMSKTEALYYLELITKDFLNIEDDGNEENLERILADVESAQAEMLEQFSENDPLVAEISEVANAIRLGLGNILDGDYEFNNGEEIGVMIVDIVLERLDGELPPTLKQGIQTEDEEEGSNEETSVIPEIDGNLENFVEMFNMYATLSDDTDPIDESLIETQVRSETQTLYESDEYEIQVVYNDNENITSYIVNIPKEQPYEELKGQGLNGLLHVATVFELDLDRFAEEFEESLNDSMHFYDENGYVITFFNFEKSEDNPAEGMTVWFVDPSIQ